MEVIRGRDSSKITKEDLKEIFEEPLDSINLSTLIQNYLQLISGDDEMIDLLVDYVVRRVPTETVECYLLLRDILQIDKKFQKAALKKFKNHKAVVENLYIIKAIDSSDEELSKLAKEVASLLCRNSNYKELFGKMFAQIPLDQIGSTARIEKTIRPLPRVSNRNYLAFDSISSKKSEHNTDGISHAVMPKPGSASHVTEGRTSGISIVEEERTKTGTYVTPVRNGETLEDDTDSSSSSSSSDDSTNNTTTRTRGVSITIGTRTVKEKEKKTNKERKTNIIQKIEGDNTEVTKVETFTISRGSNNVGHSVRPSAIRNGTTDLSDDSDSDDFPTIFNDNTSDNNNNNNNTSSDSSTGPTKKVKEQDTGCVAYERQISVVIKAEIPLCTEDSPKLLISIDDNPRNNKAMFDMIAEDKGAGIIVKTFSSSVEFKSFVTRNIRTLMSYKHSQDKIRFMTDRSRVEVSMANTLEENNNAVQDNHAYKNVIGLVRDEIRLDKAKILIYTGSGIGNIKLLHSPIKNLFVTWFEDIAFQFAYFSDEIDYRF